MGDPSGRSSERPELSRAEVEANVHKISENLHRVFENHKQIFWDRGNDEPLPTLR